MKRKIIKGLTIILFSTLITSFVAYRSGFFGGLKLSYSVSPNGSALKTQNDSIKKKDSIKKVSLMPSSKVLIIKDYTIQVGDTVRIETDTSSKIKPLIFSTKSAIILKPDDLTKTLKDSTLIDSLKK